MKKAVEAGTLAALMVGAVCGARWLGSRPDPPLEQFLQGPSAVERLLAQSEREGNGEADEPKSPLVAQAEAFARYLNPPAPPRRTPPPARSRVPGPEIAPITISPKFRLIGISYHRSNPAESRALISEPGGTQRWVKPGAELGRLRVARINRGSILYEDGAGMQEMTMETEPAPMMPVQRLPELPPPGDDIGQTAAIAHRDAPDDEYGEEAVEVARPAVPIEEPAVARVGPPEASPVPGRRPRPVRPVARKE